MYKILMLFLLFTRVAFSQDYQQEIVQYQQKLIDWYLKAESTPLKEEELKVLKD